MANNKQYRQYLVVTPFSCLAAGLICMTWTATAFAMSVNYCQARQQNCTEFIGASLASIHYRFPEVGMIFKKKNGFTLIELMIVVVIAAILLMVALPSSCTRSGK